MATETQQQPPRGSEDDFRLARGCAGGNTDTFSEIYRRFGERMKSTAFHHLGNVSDAEDAVQDTFVKLHRAARGYSGQAAFTTWLYRILVNTCYDIIRKRRRRVQETPIDAAIENSRAGGAVDDAKRLTLGRLLAALPEQRRSVFVLFEIEGLSHAEIAGILGITEGNSKWILFATKKQLQEQWNNSSSAPGNKRIPARPAADQSKGTPKHDHLL